MSTIEPDLPAQSTFIKWSLHLHVRAYRAVCDRIITFTKKATLWTASFPILTIYKSSRRIPAFDFAAVLAMRRINRTYENVRGSPLCQELITTAQERQKSESERLKSAFGEKSVHPKFCALTSRYIHAFIDKSMGELSYTLPEKAEKFRVFRMISHIPGINVKKIGSRVVGAIDEKAVNAVINFEYLLLHFCQQLNPYFNSERTQPLLETAIRSLGFSLGQQKELDLYLKDFAHLSPEEQFIARIAWHKQNNSLPPGVLSEGLTQDNLRANLEKGLKNYLEQRVEQLLAHLFPDELKTGTAGFLYKKWGKDQFRDLLVYLFYQFVIKLLTDPHCLSQAILKMLGEDVTDGDLQGYGRGQKQKILETGQKILYAALNIKDPQFARIYASSQLKFNQSGMEALHQKNEIRNRLRACLSKLIYDKIKPEQFRHPDEWFKETRAALGSIPVVGTVTTGLHLLFRTPTFALNYWFREEGQNDVSFAEWMTKHFVGQKMANAVADRTVDLIHQPSWYITVLQLIEATIASLLVPQPPGQAIGEELYLIAEFLREHFNITLPISVRQLSDKVHQRMKAPDFQKFLPQANLLEKSLETLQPTIKELYLVTRVVEACRKLERFDGDYKFWDSYVREALNQQVAHKIRKSESSSPPTKKDIALLRENLLNHYLELNEQALLSALYMLPPYFEIKQWNQIPREDGDGFSFLDVDTVDLLKKKK